MNTNDNQPIVDAMLDEWLGNRKPRPLDAVDLSDRLVDPQRAAELEMALQAASADLRNRARLSPASVYRQRTSYSFSFKALAALAACLVVGLGFWAYSNRDQIAQRFSPPSSIVAMDQASPAKPDRPSDALIVESMAKSDPSQERVNAKSIAPKVDRESLSLEALPFSAGESEAAQSKDSQDRLARVQKVSETELIALIDRQMQSLWKNHDAKPSAPVSGQVWINRVCQQVLSRAATQEEKDAFAKKDSTGLRLEMLHRIVDRPEFSQVWAKRLAAHYLDDDSLPSQKASDERRAFVQWIRRELNTSHRLDLIAKNIMLTPTRDASVAESLPSSQWWVEAGLQSKTAPAERFASKFLGTRASCSRCHDSNAVANANQSQFWGLAAITQGIEVNRTADNRKSRIELKNSVKPLFYERNDASMVAATASLPNGTPLNTQPATPAQASLIAKKNLTALSDWMMQSDELARSHANFVWDSLIGQPLVTDYPLDESEGRKERNELIETLGRQLQANGYDLRQIVVWIAASQAFSLDSIRRDGNWYLTASEQDVQAHQRRQKLMASFPVSLDNSFKSLDQLAQWIDSNASNSEQGNRLAQPLPLAPPSGNPAKSKASATGPAAKAAAYTQSQVQYLIEAQLLPKALRDEVDRMLKADLAWNDLVDHAFYMTGNTSPTSVDRDAAQRILDSSRDRRLAINRIIAARL